MQVTELGHLVLFVRDLETSASFYRDVLGWDVAIPVTPDSPVAAFTSGRTHHELLLLEVGDGAAPQSSGRHLGLYHFGLKIGDTDDELREALTTLRNAGVEIKGITDHTISHSLYISDPDGNEIELYVDVPGVDWKSDPSLLTAAPRALRP